MTDHERAEALLEEIFELVRVAAKSGTDRASIINGAKRAGHPGADPQPGTPERLYWIYRVVGKIILEFKRRGYDLTLTKTYGSTTRR